MKFAQLGKRLIVMLLLAASQALAASQWDESASALALKIVAVFGAGQARLEIRNQSSLSSQDVAAIRKLLETDLKQHGIVTGANDSADEVRVTLSENLSQRVWVAEIQLGNETKVVMTLAGPLKTAVGRSRASVLLQASPLLTVARMSPTEERVSGQAVILSLAGDEAGVVILQADSISFYEPDASGFILVQTLALSRNHAMSRDPRGRVILHSGGQMFTAYLPGQQCEGMRPEHGNKQSTASVQCRDSDDPWPLGRASYTENALFPENERAFYNSAQNYFTGMVTPALSFDLPPFFDAVEWPRGGGRALLIHETSGAVELIEGKSRKTISGVRDWGSDLAVLHTQCGVEPVVLVSASGEAFKDSLRAYTIPAQEAVAASAPLALDGAVMSMTQWNENSAAVVVRIDDGNGASHDEVLRVSTLCS